MTRGRKIVIGYGVILLWTFLPFIPVVIAGLIASYKGVPLDEGGPHPCMVFGHDIGGLLYSMGVMGWFGLLTVPTGFLALLVFTIFIITRRVFEEVS